MECIADVGAVLGEGPVWVVREGALYWVDIPQKRLFRWSDADGLLTVEMADHVCSIVPRESGGFVGGGYGGLISIDSDYAITPLGKPDALAAEGHNRFNDGKVDRQGRFWAGTMDRTEQAASGKIYRIAHDLTWNQIDSGYRVTNGPAFSPDGRKMYHTDSARQRIYAFDLDVAGEASNRRVFAQFGEGQGYPDGMTVDVEGCLWVAFWAGWCVRRFSPQGEIVTEIATPVACPTSCAFGGAALDELFITSASRDLSAKERAEQPLAGGLFRTRPGVIGIAELPFAG